MQVPCLLSLATGGLLISLIGFVLLYGTLAGADVYLMKKFAIAGPDFTEHEEAAEAEPAVVGAQD